MYKFVLWGTFKFANYGGDHFVPCLRQSEEVICVESGDQWEIRPSDVGYRNSLGQGAFGEVYKAVVRQLGGTRDKVVAVKRLKGRPELPFETDKCQKQSDCLSELALSDQVHKSISIFYLFSKLQRVTEKIVCSFPATSSH